MSRMRLLGAVVGVLAVLATASGCSSDGDTATTTTSRPPVVFKAAPAEATRLGACKSLTIERMKELIGGEERFRALAPEAIGEEGDAVTGEACSWERKGPGENELSVRVEVRDYGTDTAGLVAKFDELKTGTVAATDADVGDAAFTSQSEETSLVQIRKGSFLITASSLAAGDLDPIDVGELTFVAATPLDVLP